CILAMPEPMAFPHVNCISKEAAGVEKFTDISGESFDLREGYRHESEKSYANLHQRLAWATPQRSMESREQRCADKKNHPGVLDVFTRVAGGNRLIVLSHQK